MPAAALAAEKPRSQQPELPVWLRKKLMQLVGPVRTIHFGDGLTVPELIKAGNYGDVSYRVENFVRKAGIRVQREKGEADIVYLDFSELGFPSLEIYKDDVLETFWALGLEMPQEEDALRIGKEYPDDQKTGGSIVFVHPHEHVYEDALCRDAPALSAAGVPQHIYHYVLMLGHDYKGRHLDMTSTDSGLFQGHTGRFVVDGWNKSQCRFAARLPRTQRA